MNPSNMSDEKITDIATISEDDVGISYNHASRIFTFSTCYAARDSQKNDFNLVNLILWVWSTKALTLLDQHF